MEIVLNEYILRNIFQYLNGADLCSVAQVNSNWNRAAKEEQRKRGPICSYKDYFMGLPKNWNDIKRDIIDKCPNKPMLHMAYTYAGFTDKFSNGCFCQFLPHDCQSISVETYSIRDEDNIINNMFLPNAANLTIDTLTFNVHAWDYGVYCDELNFIFDFYFKNAEPLRDVFDPVLNDDSNLNNCLILLYEETKEFIASNILRCLHEWYPNRISSIWGGLVKKLEICKKIEGFTLCTYGVDCIAIMISGSNMQTWNLVMDAKESSIESIEKTFKDFSKEIKLKKHSIGLMFSSDYCDNCYFNLEPPIFRQYFPNTPLFQILGFLSIGADDVSEADSQITDGYRRMLELSITIITYD
ncbi:hypothetical protein M0804_009680 [Polistes exclamans]|nr:hypothetical protein M0804_009680 [Polistes exclamans]